LIREARIHLVDEEPSAGSTQALSTGGRRRNRRLEPNEILAGLSRVEPDNRAPLCSECKTFRFAIEIAQDPRIKERSSSTSRAEIIDPCNRGGLVTEQIEATVWAHFEVTEVGAGFRQYLVGKPDCERNEPVAPILDWPPLAVRQSAASD
jgi:hypothetical protein